MLDPLWLPINPNKPPHPRLPSGQGQKDGDGSRAFPAHAVPIPGIPIANALSPHPRTSSRCLPIPSFPRYAKRPPDLSYPATGRPQTGFPRPFPACPRCQPTSPARPATGITKPPGPTPAKPCVLRPDGNHTHRIHGRPATSRPGDPRQPPLPTNPGEGKEGRQSCKPAPPRTDTGMTHPPTKRNV